MENEILFNKIDKMLKELENNVEILKGVTNQISCNLYKLDCSAAKLEELKEKFNKIREAE